jgi:hypothetical protein
MGLKHAKTHRSFAARFADSTKNRYRYQGDSVNALEPKVFRWRSHIRVRFESGETLDSAVLQSKMTSSSVEKSAPLMDWRFVYLLRIVCMRVELHFALDSSLNSASEDEISGSSVSREAS